MGYSKQLLDRAAAAAGSRYALSKMTGIPQGNLSEAANGIRQVPASWVLDLATIAGVDPGTAMTEWKLERQAKKKAQRETAGQSGGAETSPTSEPTSAGGNSPPKASAKGRAGRPFDLLRIVSTERRHQPCKPVFRARNGSARWFTVRLAARRRAHVTPEMHCVRDASRTRHTYGRQMSNSAL